MALLANIGLGCKILTITRTLAYFFCSSSKEEKIFVIMKLHVSNKNIADVATKKVRTFASRKSFKTR